MDLLLPGGSGSGEINEMGHAVTHNATEDDLIDALAAMERGDIEYVILEDSARKLFMQTAGDARSGYDLQYNNGADDVMFQARSKMSGAQITEAFMLFLNQDNAWRTMFDWERFTY
jgi:hypothetical protein